MNLQINFDYLVFSVFVPKTLKLFGISIVPDAGFSRNASCTLNLTSTFALILFGEKYQLTSLHGRQNDKMLENGHIT
jgi:hypothetical protein